MIYWQKLHRTMDDVLDPLFDVAQDRSRKRTAQVRQRYANEELNYIARSYA